MNLKTKVFITILLGIILPILIIDNSVKASSNDAEQKILRYDAKTGKITEVEDEELTQVMNYSSNIKQCMKLSAYDPYKVENSTKSAFNSVMKVSPGYRVTDTSIFPYRTTCRVTYKGKDAEGNIANYRGSASLVGPNLALTCAHVIFDKDDRYNPFNDWTCYPGFNDVPYVNEQYGSCMSGYSQVYFSSSYLLGLDELDWALCVLEEPLGQYLGYFGLQDYSTEKELLNMNVTATGYPADENYGFNSNTQWKSSGTIKDVDSSSFKFDALIFGGYSGGPVWRNDDYTMVGITAWTNRDTYGQAVRTNSRIITLITNLREQWNNENL